MSQDLEQVSKSLAALDAYAKYNRLGGYDPYPFQMRYHSCRNEAGEYKRQVMLMCVNQIGKTESGMSDVAYHATGLYPEWWDRRGAPRLNGQLRKFPDIWCSGPNNEKVRDLAQSRLCGKWQDPTAFGTGFLPKDSIVGTNRKPGVPDAHENVIVKHKDGFNVAITFKAAQAGKDDYMGEPVSYVNLDEEHPLEIYTQCMARTTATKGPVKMTMTPENGLTELVAMFWNEQHPNRMLINATHADARHPDGRSHLDVKAVKELLDSYPVHEREMREKGIPVFGKGLVIPVPDAWIVCDPIRLSDHFFHVGGLDFGSGGNNHPSACVKMAVDRDSGKVYLYYEYRSWATEVAVHCAAINTVNPWVPLAWPHDGNRKDGYGGPTIANLYRKSRSNPGGLVLMQEHFENPDGGRNVEEGIAAMIKAMQAQQFYVFATCKDFMSEKRQYHRDPKNGGIVDNNDDLISAARLAFMSRSKAIREPDERRMEAMRGFRTPGVSGYNPLTERTL